MQPPHDDHPGNVSAAGWRKVWDAAGRRQREGKRQEKQINTLKHPSDLGPFVQRLLARSHLTDEEQHAILALPTRELDVRAKQDFVPLGKETDYCCYIASGLVARVSQLKNGTRQTTALHIPGDMADLHSAVRPIGIGGLTALTDTLILRVPHAAVWTLGRDFPAIAEAFWRDCILDAAILMRWAINLGRKDARSRLAHILCELAIRYGGSCGDPLLEFDLPMVQEQLGDAAALTSVHVNRSLRTLRQERLVTVRGGIVKIHDWEHLMQAAEFDPTYLVADTFPDRQRCLVFQ